MAVITELTIKELAGIRSSEVPIVSCYLDVDGRREIRPADYQRRLDSMARATATAHPDVDLSTDLDRISEMVHAGIERSGVRGLAMFSCASKGLWEVFHLPVPVANRIVVNQSPAVAPLEGIVQELEPLAALLVDRQRARLFVFEFGAVVERDDLFEALPREYDRSDHAGRGTKEREAHHVDELAMQHLRHAADAAFALHRDRGIGHLTIAATDDVHAALVPILHPYLRDRLAPRLHVAVSASEAEIVPAVAAVEAEMERAREADVVAKLLDAAGARRRGVVGLGETLTALNERRVATLVVSNGFVESGWICGCGALALRGPTCSIDGAEMVRTEDVVSDAVDAGFGEGARIVICEDNADLDVHGRIGALLRY